MGNKYNARKTPCAQGHTHDSGREAKRCNDLHMLQRAGEISDLKIQQQFRFSIDGRAVKLKNGHHAGIKVDFVYRENGQDIAEDSKGYVVRDWPLRRAIFCALHPDIELREV